MEAGRGGYLYLKQSRHDFEARVPSATREKIMLESPSVRPMIEAAKKAVDRGFDSIWAGDSLLARPRHDPITLLAGVAGAIPGIEVGTAVLLPAVVFLPKAA